MFINLEKNELDYIINTHYQKEKSSVLERANRLLEGVFIFQNDWDMERSHEAVQLNLTDMDWNYTPNPDLEWSYMLHRQSYLMDLIISYYYTKDEHYLDFYYKFVDQWIDENPYNHKNKKYSWRSLDTAIRITNWIRIKEILEISDRAWPEKFEKSLHEQADYVFAHLEASRAQSNWLAIESAAYIIYSFDQKEFKENYKKSMNIFEHCLHMQILKDGLQWEQSFMYHHEVLISALQVIHLSQSHHKRISKYIVNKAKQMHLASLALMRVDNKQSNFGDSDYEDMRSLMLASEKILKQASFQEQVESQLFDFLLSGLHQDNQGRLEPESISKHQLEEAGLAIVKDRNKENNFMFSYGPLGGGHGHDDYLHFEWMVHGKELFVDSGRYTYYEENNSRLYFKEAKAHNTLLVNNQNYNRHIDSWSSEFVGTPINQKVFLGERIDYFEGGHLAYSDEETLRLINRRLILIDQEILCIFDELKSCKKDKLTSNFILSPNNLELKEGRILFKQQQYELKALNNLEIERKDCEISPSYNLKYFSDRLLLSSTGKNIMNKIVVLPQEQYEIEKLRVYNDWNEPYSEDIVEAYAFKDDEKERILLIQHQEPKDSRRAYFVADHMLYGRVVYFEKIKGEVVYEDKIF